MAPKFKLDPESIWAISEPYPFHVDSYTMPKKLRGPWLTAPRPPICSCAEHGCCLQTRCSPAGLSSATACADNGSSNIYVGLTWSAEVYFPQPPAGSPTGNDGILGNSATTLPNQSIACNSGGLASDDIKSMAHQPPSDCLPWEFRGALAPYLKESQ